MKMPGKQTEQFFLGGFSNEQETKYQHASCLPCMEMPGKNELSTIAANACQKKNSTKKLFHHRQLCYIFHSA